MSNLILKGGLRCGAEPDRLCCCYIIVSCGESPFGTNPHHGVEIACMAPSILQGQLRFPDTAQTGHGLDRTHPSDSRQPARPQLVEEVLTAYEEWVPSNWDLEAAGANADLHGFWERFGWAHRASGHEQSVDCRSQTYAWSQNNGMDLLQPVGNLLQQTIQIERDYSATLAPSQSYRSNDLGVLIPGIRCSR